MRMVKRVDVRWKLIRNHRWLGWLGVFLGCALLYGTWWVLERQRQQAEAADRDFQHRSDELYQRIVAYDRAPRDEVERELNGSRRLRGRYGEGSLSVAQPPRELLRDRAGESRTFRLNKRPTSGPVVSFRAALDGASVGPRFEGWTVYLHFVNDRLWSAHAVSPPRTRYVGPSVAWQLMRIVARLVLCGGALVWVGCVGTACGNPHWRRQISQVALAALMFVAVAWQIDPAQSWLPLAITDSFPTVLLYCFGATLVAVVIPPLRWRRRPKADRCEHCGYDLTGNESGVCPECGTVTPQGKINRWQAQAEQIAHVKIDPEPGDDASESFIQTQEEGPQAGLLSRIRLESLDKSDGNPVPSARTPGDAELTAWGRNLKGE